MGKFQKIFKESGTLWNAMKSSSRFHSVLLYIVFVIIAAVFWLVLALNDSAQGSYAVRIQIVNKPDSVTFISDVPADFHASVRDKGSALIRSGLFRQPTVSLNFRDYADNGRFRLTKADVNAQLKAVFGASATILSSSLDSLNLVYTTNKGRRIPIVVVYDCVPANGMVLEGAPKADPQYVMAYGPRNILDTLTRVFTERVVKRDLSEDKTFDVNLHKVKGLKIEPLKVKVSVNVEALVSKTEVIPIKVVGVPEGESLLLFPDQVTAEYFSPMSRFSSDHSAKTMRAEVDYMDALRSRSGKVGVRLVVNDRHIVNPRLVTDSVEYTIVR